jgi:hypothetical protein
VISRQNQSKDISKTLPKRSVQYPGGRKVSKITYIKSQPLHAFHHRLKSILDAVEQLSEDGKVVLFAIRARNGQLRVNSSGKFQKFIAQSASEPSIRQFVSHTNEGHRYNLELTARMQRVNEIIIRSSNIVTRSMKLFARSRDRYKIITSRIMERNARTRAGQLQLSKILGSGKREQTLSQYLETFPPASEPKRTDKEPLLHDFGSIESRQLRRKAAIVVRRSTAIVRTKVDKSEAAISNMQEELRKALHYIDQLESFMRAARYCAFDVYGLHVALRLRLGKMILYRQKRSHRSKMAFGRLETRLADLRAYDEVLFSIGSVTSRQQIRERLDELEQQNEVQRSLIRSTQLGAQLRARRRRQGRRNKNARHTTPPISFRRSREHKSILPVRRLPTRVTYSIRYHDSRRNRKLAQRTERARPRRSAVEKKKADKLKLLDTVSSWLGGGEAQISKKEAEGAKRVFGARTSGSERE